MKEILVPAITAMLSALVMISCSKSGTTTKPNTTPTGTSTKPTVSAITATNVGYKSATCGIAVLNTGGSEISHVGLWYGLDRDVVMNKTSGYKQGVDSETNATNCTFELKNLLRGHTYYVRVYAENTSNSGFGYGELDSFTTSRGVFVKDTFGGGIVFYMDSSYEHGLAFALTEQSDQVKWNNGADINVAGAAGTAVGTGQANTSAIIAAQGPGSYAAALCANYSGGGYHDWYLPSIGEVNAFYPVLTVLFMNLPYYWSSSQAASTHAWCMYHNSLVGDYIDTYTKSTKMHVRAVRSF